MKCKSTIYVLIISLLTHLLVINAIWAGDKFYYDGDQKIELQSVDDLQVYFGKSDSLEHSAEPTEKNIVRYVKEYIIEKKQNEIQLQSEQNSIQSLGGNTEQSKSLGISEEEADVLVKNERSNLFLFSKKKLEKQRIQTSSNNQTSVQSSTPSIKSLTSTTLNSKTNNVPLPDYDQVLDANRISNVYLGSDGNILIFPGGVLIFFEPDKDDLFINDFFEQLQINFANIKPIGNKTLKAFEIATQSGDNAMKLANLLKEMDGIRKAIPNYLVDYELK